MGAEVLSSRAVAGMFYENLEQGPVDWFPKLAMPTDSDQSSEEYKWLGQVPGMREWIGGRQAKGFRDNGFTIKNKEFESTLKIKTRDLRRDKTGQLQVRIGEHTDRALNHPVSLLSTLMLNGASGLCYDGQYFFDTDHSEGDSGTQSNSISVDISALPVGTDYHGSTTAPSAEELNASILLGIQQMYGFKDDQGEPINENAKEFVVMVPTTFWQAGQAAVSDGALRNGSKNTLKAGGLIISLYSNPRLTWTDKFAVFRADGRAKPFIHQIEKPLTLGVIGEGSEHEVITGEQLYCLDTCQNVGYGLWQHACLVTLT
jgi:phage major head subunit gpT-like protein